ncbi:hypothetical protein EDD37DRAFT_163020 [Exophiala viscosa]|uniref:Uncharacterized protein n=1 Tax=Exophiala viscosa TaxID=2486360 RepID=A0AAN6DMJ6_9EURO|nr:hypothetical protein EDD36DRAFT_68522 [Exophiala viscosa]KAI1620637.1 hypothetical protein EDD37DRAFT_163020 [Exophiala viscosa]
MVLSFLDALDTLDRGMPSDRAYSKPQSRPVSLPSSRNNSSSSLSSLRSEPGKSSSNASSKPSGFSKLFGKGKKEKKDTDKKQIITSKHSSAATVATRMALDIKYKQAHPGLGLPPRLVPTQSVPNITPQELELRKPHSGPPALIAQIGRTDMPVLTKVISGDEADDPDDFERMRDEWRERKIPDVQLLQILEGRTPPASAPGSASNSGTTTPRNGMVTPPQIPASHVIEREGVRLLSVDDALLKERPKPVRRHTPIGGRYRRDEKGVWKK